MCLIRNNKLPTTDTHYKVFGTKDGKLYFPLHDRKGSLRPRLNTRRVLKGVMCSTEEGFHVFKKKEHAGGFARLLRRKSQIAQITTLPLVVKRVRCKELIKSGIALYGCSNLRNALTSNGIVGQWGQAYAYKTIEVIR